MSMSYSETPSEKLEAAKLEVIELLERDDWKWLRARINDESWDWIRIFEEVAANS